MKYVFIQCIPGPVMIPESPGDGMVVPQHITSLCQQPDLVAVLTHFSAVQNLLHSHSCREHDAMVNFLQLCPMLDLCFATFT